MARDKNSVPTMKDNKDFDNDYDNEAFDEFSDDYEDDERYGYSTSLQSEIDGRRGNGFSYCGSAQSSYEINEDSRKDHHNQLERKRRASIKSSYCELREAIPTLRDNKASRSVILQKAVEYLEELDRRNMDHAACVDHFASENSLLETKCRDIQNQVQILMRQSRCNGYANSSYQSYQSNLSRSSSLRLIDEDSNDLSGSTNSTPNASTSRSVISSTSTGTNPNSGTNGNSSSVDSQQSKFENIDKDNVGTTQFKIDENNRNDKQLFLANSQNETCSTSSSLDCCDDIDDILAAKRHKRS